MPSGRHRAIIRTGGGNHHGRTSPAGAPGDAIFFTGTWREYAPIAFSNLALTIVTLGIYRFWAKVRERRYLWSHTRFIDDGLEWTGTGREMFIGFLAAMVVVGPIFLLWQFGTQALAARGMVGLAAVAMVLSYVVLLLFFGLARFRGLRYRLARTLWHGIRGGSDDLGFKYAVSYLWKTVVGALAIALLVPWSMTQLWNERWNRMSFGGFQFESSVTTDGLMGRWIVLLLSPPLLAVPAFLVATLAFGGATGGQPSPGFAIGGLLFVLGFYAAFALIGLGYYAAYFRAAVDNLELGGLRFGFDARSKDWLLLFLGDVALVIGTLGIGIAFLGYRHWSFLIRHLGATGTIALDDMVQSPTQVPREAEGLMDAFDLGAI